MVSLGEVQVKPIVATAMQDSVPRQARGRLPDRGRATPHRLLVLGVDTADMVSGVGGLVCDSVRAGLQVEVCLETVGDDRALQILGVRARALPVRFDFDPQWPDAVVFAAALYERNQAVRRLVADSTRRRRSDVASWGGAWPTEPDSGMSVDHRLSSAARAFKLHAMKASGIAAHVSSTEPFRSGQLRLADVTPLTSRG
jgi:hypothetical protein